VTSICLSLPTLHYDTRSTTHQIYRYVVQSNIVPRHKIVPQTFRVMNSNFVRRRHFGNKRFHDGCLSQSERVLVIWYTFHFENLKSLHEAIETLLKGRCIWCCNFFDRPIFIQPECVLSLE